MPDDRVDALDGGAMDAEAVFPCGAAAAKLASVGCAEATNYLATCKAVSGYGFLPASDPGCVADPAKITKDALRKCGNVVCP